MIGPLLTLFAVTLQSIGKVLYGTFLLGVPTERFLLFSLGATALIFLAIARLRMPRAGRGSILSINLWTAVSFVCFFIALRYLTPATAAAVEIGVSIATATTLAALRTGRWPTRARLVACGGIACGAVLLALAEGGRGSDHGALTVGLAIGVCAVGGVATAMVATAIKQLAAAGWSSAEVMAHRFYFVILAALAWSVAGEGTLALPSMSEGALIGGIGLVAVLLPILILQIALRKTEALTVMICIALQPLISFVVSLGSPSYAWSGLACAGVVLVTAALAFDLMLQRRAALARGNAKPAAAAPVLVPDACVSTSTV